MAIRRNVATPCCAQTVLVSWVAEFSDLLCAASNWDFRGAHFNTPICKLGYQTIEFGYCALQIDPVITQTPFFFFDGLQLCNLQALTWWTGCLPGAVRSRR